MRFVPQLPKKALKAYLKQRPLRTEIDLFKANLINLLDKISIIENQPRDESEEHLKNNLRDFLRDTYYRDTNAINTKDKKDLVIHLNKTTGSEVGVIIEAKRPANLGEMVTVANPNKKALHELILYYLDERTKEENNQLKQLVITNIHEWYIVDANAFDKHIYRNVQIKKLYEIKQNDKKDNPWFYEEIAKILAKADTEIPCVYFNIKDYEPILRNSKKEDDRELIALFKVLSPSYLLKMATPNDGNSLNPAFYKELLHIIGLEEAKDNGKNIIRRKKEGKNQASLIELTIEALQTEDTFHKLPDISVYGASKEERVFNIALELCITWVNRILFLKLLEGQLITYHQGDKSYRFLNSETIHDFDELFKLFHKVLAVNIPERTQAILEKYNNVPYLNSSLFEISELEDLTIKINSLGNSEFLELGSGTILKEQKAKAGKLQTLGYLLRFLDAYDFSSEGTEEVQEDNKTIINASVLGKVFEKINGYKDGSIFTPAFITMYMCRQSIRLAVLEKFNQALSEPGTKSFDQFDDIKNYTSRLFKTHEVLIANEIVNSLRLCDPAVGSGHFLVSALNEIIAIKAELGILSDDKGNILAGYEIEIVNDELIITDQIGNPVEYKLQTGKPINKEVQRLQKALFHEKQTIIENCLFGVDINPKSVLICRLRLWIELLKNAYYKEPDFAELETLPNIDINIKCGNSLLSRFGLDSDLSQAPKSIKYDVKAYREFVNDYKNEKSREVKRGLQQIINTIKSDFRTEINKNDPKQLRLERLTGDLYILVNQGEFFERSAKEKKAKKEKQQKIEAEINKLNKEIAEIKDNILLKNSFEWRFEFPEVLNNNGDFEGFDVVLGNPPYIQIQKLEEDTKRGLEHQGYFTFTKTGDIYQLFYELGLKILKPGGQLGYITSNKWMRTDYGQSTRRLLSLRCNTHLIVDFGMALVFENATILTNMLFLSKEDPKPKMRMCRVKEEYDETVLLEDYVDWAAVMMDNPGERSWIAYDRKEYAIIKKIIEQGKPLRDWDIQINRGILTGFNEAFVINTETKDRLVAEDPRSAEILMPMLRGEDIKAYVPQWAGLWLINAHNGIKNSHVTRVDIVKDYPAIFNWLTKHQTALEKRYDKGDHWTNLRNCAYIDEFNKSKIIYPNMTKYMPFVYDKHQFFTNQKCFIITGKNLGYLTAFLNSIIFRFAFRDNFPELLGDTKELSKVFFEQVAVREVDEKTERAFSYLIDRIMELKEDGKSTLALEEEIDDALAQLYSLSDTDMGIIKRSEKAGYRDLPATTDLSELVSS